MTIGIDIRVLANPYRSGIDEYTAQLLSCMLPLDSAIKYKLYLSGMKQLPLDFDFFNLPNVSVWRYKASNRFVLNPLQMLFGRPKLDLLLGGVDVFFSPHLFMPVSLSGRCRFVTTVHDLAFLHFPEFFPLDKLAWHRLETRPKQQLKRADAVIAVSDSTKQDIERFYGVKSEKIKIIYSGVTNSLNTASGKKRVRDINGNFILFLGTIEPRKNVIGLIKAFEILKKEHKRKEKLVIAGHQGWFYHDVYKAAAQSQYTKEIIFTGSVTPEEKSALCKSASVFVYPSFFEGFGFPSLEAMAHGTPVVTSHTSSLPEVVGNAALMVNPWHPQELAAAINTFLTDRETRSVFIRRGFKNAVRFPWKHCAEETLQTLAASIKV